MFQLIIILLSKRCTQRSITYMYPSAFGLSYALTLITLWYQREEENMDDFGYEKFIILYSEMASILIGFLCYSTIFCPSLFFMVCVYIPIYLTIHVTYAYLRYDMTDDTIFFD